MPRLERLDIRLEEAARDLGAGAFQTFRLITFPLLLPALVSAYMVAFVLSFDEIVVASFIAGDTTTFPLYLFSQLRFPTLLPQVIAVACIVMAASVLLLIGAEIGRRVVERRLGTDLAAPPTGRGLALRHERAGEHGAPVHRPGEDDVAARLDARAAARRSSGS